uniref:variable large family protein n=1 Tax=Borreliella afzelii TaxID=29518 RepID=UPI003BF513DA
AKAAGAVTAVSGEQILKAIVEAAGDADQAGEKAADAKNPIEAAIGTDDDGAEFGDDMKKRNDKIAAAIVLRGVAKDGKFAVADANSKASVKSAVESAVQKTFTTLTNVVRKAVETGLKKVADAVQKESGSSGKKASSTSSTSSTSSS